MNNPQNQGKMTSTAQTQIAPTYNRAIATSANHYKPMSEFSTQDIEEIAGGVK